MKNKKILQILFWIFLLLFISYAVLYSFIPLFYHETNENTEECCATVEKVIYENKQKYAHIYTNEYEPSLFVLLDGYSEKVIKKIQLLKNGERISFRVSSSDYPQLTKSATAIQILSLSVENKSIFTLEDSNCIEKQNAKEAEIRAGIASVVFMLLTIFCIIILVKDAKKSGKKVSVYTENMESMIAEFETQMLQEYSAIIATYQEQIPEGYQLKVGLLWKWAPGSKAFFKQLPIQNGYMCFVYCNLERSNQSTNDCDTIAESVDVNKRAEWLITRVIKRIFVKKIVRFEKTYSVKENMKQLLTPKS